MYSFKEFGICQKLFRQNFTINQQAARVKSTPGLNIIIEKIKRDLEITMKNINERI